MRIGISTKIQKALCRASQINEYEKSIISDKCGISLDIYNDKSKSWFTYCSPVYKFSNENIAGYYSKFDFEDKRVLTVCGSGDHVLNAILLGAREIDCFDISMFAFLYFDLKRAAIKALTYEEYIDFFYYIHTNSKDLLNLYSKIYRFLEPESKMFWDSLFIELDPRLLMKSQLFDPDRVSLDDIYDYNLYLKSEDEYNELKGKLDFCKVNFENSNIKNLFSKCEGTYDFIGLSNIYGRSYDENQPFNKEIVQLSKLLSDDGVMVANYEWMTRRVNYNELIDVLSKNNECDFLRFENFYGIENIALRCRKRKK